MIRRILTAAALGLCLTGMAWAGDDDDTKKKMVVGDKAPPIDIAHWIKGVEIERGKPFKPMTDFEDGKVYVLDGIVGEVRVFEWKAGGESPSGEAKAK